MTAGINTAGVRWILARSKRLSEYAPQREPGDPLPQREPGQYAQAKVWKL